MRPPLPLSQQADIADQAADELMIRGGTRGTLLDPSTGRVCLNGALALALGFEEKDLDHLVQPSDPEIRALCVGQWRLKDLHYEGLHLVRLSSKCSCLVCWNDADTTTDDDRIELLRLIAKNLRERAT